MQHREGGGALGWLALAAVLGLGLLCWLPMNPKTDRGRPYPTLLVLGAAQYNGHPSPLFRARLDHALSLYRAGGVRNIVISGGVGRGDRFSEGRVGLRYLESQGVPAGVLTAETHSKDTVENLRNSRALLSGPVTLVTDEAHAPRALALAKAMGYTANSNSAPLGGTNSMYHRRERLLLAAYALVGVMDKAQKYQR